MIPTWLQLANALRFLSIDAIQKAGSGHPGMPMGMADIATVLWQKYLRHSPHNPEWINRDRFVLSNGHGSMLLYALLHLSGYKLTIDDLKQFRELHSKTPGHPEFGLTPGVETTTGPLGQGLANAVGMAIAERLLASKFNHDNLSIIDHYTYVFVGDGCLMEGISHEVCSLAGTLGLGRLIIFWDDNGISIDGSVQQWFDEDVSARFAAYGFQVIEGVDGHDHRAVDRAIASARENLEKPTIICCKTQIGYGSPNFVGTEKCHGAALGEDEIKLVRAKLDWTHPPFTIPDIIYQSWNAVEYGKKQEEMWKEKWAQYQKDFPELATELDRRMCNRMPEDWAEKTESWCQAIAKQQRSNPVAKATRKASQDCLNQLVVELPEIFGGSADLSGSNCTLTKYHKAVTNGHWHGNYLHYGVREFGMFAIMNGLALHGGFIPYGGTFLTFVDYGRNAVRLSALMKQKLVYVFTHDSIGLGEDGPTHQPIEHASILRLTPGVCIWRPADLMETMVAWVSALSCQGPSCLLLSRQKLPVLPFKKDRHHAIKKGGYVVWESGDTCQAVLIATGSEVSLALEAGQELHQKHGLQVRVISMPSTDVFDQQPPAYRQSILLSDAAVVRVAIEAGSSAYWKQYVGLSGIVIGIDRYGESAPSEQVYAEMGLTKERIIESVISRITN